MKYGEMEMEKPTATWRFVIRDAHTGEVLKEIVKKNILTTAFKNFLASAWASGAFQTSGSRYKWYLVLGTGSGTPSDTDTGLFSAVPTSAKSGSLSSSNNTVQYYVRYLPEDANGYTYTEAGIYDHCSREPGTDYTTGQLINHLLIDPAITKDSSILVDVYVTITFP